MAIEFNAASAAFGTSVSGLTTPSWTISGDNRCMVGAIMWAHGVFTNLYDFGAMRWGGVGGTDFTQFGTRVLHSTGTMAIVTARLIAPTVMTSTLYGELTGVVTRLFVGAANYTGVDQVDPLGTPVDASLYPGPPSISITINPDEWALSWLITSGGAITPAESQNQRWEIENLVSASSDDRTGSGSVDFSWTVGGPNQWYHLTRAVALKPVVHLHSPSSAFLTFLRRRRHD